MAARGVKVALESLSQLKLPAILHWDMNHFVVLTHVNGDTITVNDPARGRRVLKLAEASDHYTGVAMEMTPAAGFKRRDEREQISAWQLVRTATGLKVRSRRFCCFRWCSRSGDGDAVLPAAGGRSRGRRT